MKFQRDNFYPQLLLKLCSTSFRLFFHVLAQNEQATTWRLIKLADFLRTTGWLPPSVKLSAIAFNRASLRRHKFWALQVKATSLQYLGRYSDSNHCFEKAISIGAGIELSYAYQHYGKSLVEQRRYDEAERFFLKALSIREEAEETVLIQSTQRAIQGLNELTK